MRKPARRPIVFTRDDRAVTGTLGRGPRRDGEPLARLRVAAHGGCRRRVRDVDSDRTPSSDTGFDYKLPFD